MRSSKSCKNASESEKTDLDAFFEILFDLVTEKVRKAFFRHAPVKDNWLRKNVRRRIGFEVARKREKRYTF